MSGRTIGCGVSPEEKAEIEAYIAVKGRWRTVPALVRDAVYQLMARNAPSARQQARIDTILGKPPIPTCAVLRRLPGGNQEETVG